MKEKGARRVGPRWQHEPPPRVRSIQLSWTHRRAARLPCLAVNRRLHWRACAARQPSRAHCAPCTPDSFARPRTRIPCAPRAARRPLPENVFYRVLAKRASVADDWLRDAMRGGEPHEPTDRSSYAGLVAGQPLRDDGRR